MGCTSEQSDCNSDEKPVHTVKVDGFYIGKYEVTQAQYEAIMGVNPSYFKGYNRPVDNVSWYDTVIFLLNNRFRWRIYRYQVVYI